MTLLTLLLGLAFLVLMVALYLAVLSRHKKSGTQSLKLIGATGVVDSTLDPEGSVIVDGELWRARVANGRALQKGDRILVIRFEGPLMLVQPLSDEL
jgi:membrane-bound ClpP family serine protease